VTDEREAVREDVIESMERSAEVYGLSRSAGRVYGVLYFAEEPLSIADLVEETGYAKSTISNTTRTLGRLGLVHRRSSDGGGRQVAFEAETDVWFVLRDVLRQFGRREVDGTRRTLDRALDRLDEVDGEAAYDRERVEELRATYDDLGALLDATTERSLPELLDRLGADEDRRR
jgi:DNA-binding transcriptional regulator GbsR (MarR family)